jgi:hypothetical protein
MPNSTERQQKIMTNLAKAANPGRLDLENKVSNSRLIEDQLLDALSEEQVKAYLGTKSTVMKEYAERIS